MSIKQAVIQVRNVGPFRVKIIENQYKSQFHSYEVNVADTEMDIMTCSSIDVGLVNTWVSSHQTLNEAQKSFDDTVKMHEELVENMNVPA